MATAAPPPSRAALCRWASSVCNTGVGKSMALEKQCANGVIFCQIIEAARPGTITMAKVNMNADAEHQSLPNYKLVTAGLDKLGITTPIDTQLLAKGQPQAVLQLLQLLYAANPPESPAKKGLAPLDANSSGANGRGAKRRAPDTKKEAATTAEAEPSAEPLPQPAEPLPSAIETALRTQLEDTRAQLILSRTKAQHLIEERDFYVQKLELIEDACQQDDASEDLSARILRLLRADENEVAGAALGE